jgi:hypothetical protein
MFLRLPKITDPPPDLDALKRWHTDLLGSEPYFDQPLCVASMSRAMLALDPDARVDADRAPNGVWLTPTRRWHDALTLVR